MVSVLVFALGPGLVPGGAAVARAESAPASTKTAKPQNEEAVARNLYREAKELKAAGKLSLALEKYRAAYETLPTPTLLWPIAELSLQLGQPVEGLEALRHYRQSMTPALMEPGQQVADAEKLEKRLRERLGQVRFTGGNGALVLLDGREIGRAPINEPLAVNPGSHRIDSTTARGTQTSVVEIGPGEELPVSLAESSGPADSKQPITAPAGTSYRIHPMPAVLLGVASGLLGVATVLGALAMDKTVALNAQCPDHLCIGLQGSDLGGLSDAVTAQHNFSTSAIALWAVGGVLLTSGVVLLAVDVQRQRSGHRLFAWSLTPQLEVAARGVSSGLLLGGRF